MPLSRFVQCSPAQYGNMFFTAYCGQRRRVNGSCAAQTNAGDYKQRSDVRRRLMGYGGECWPVGRSAVFKIWGPEARRVFSPLKGLSFLLFLRFLGKYLSIPQPHDQPYPYRLLLHDLQSVNTSRGVVASLASEHQACSSLLEDAGSFQVFPLSKSSQFTFLRGGVTAVSHVQMFLDIRVTIPRLFMRCSIPCTLGSTTAWHQPVSVVRILKCSRFAKS